MSRVGHIPEAACWYISTKRPAGSSEEAYRAAASVAAARAKGAGGGGPRGGRTWSRGRDLLRLRWRLRWRLWMRRGLREGLRGMCFPCLARSSRQRLSATAAATSVLPRLPWESPAFSMTSPLEEETS